MRFLFHNLYLYLTYIVKTYIKSQNRIYGLIYLVLVKKLYPRLHLGLNGQY